MGGLGSGDTPQASARPLVEASQRLAFGDVRRVLDGNEEALLALWQGTHFVMAAIRPGAMQIRCSGRATGSIRSRRSRYGTGRRRMGFGAVCNAHSAYA